MRTDRPQYDVVNRWRSAAVLGGSPARVHARPLRKVPAGAAVLVAVAEELRAALEAAGLLTLTRGH